MKANEAPKKIYIDVSLDSAWGMMERSYDNEVEYIRTDAFIDKAKKWFEQQPETYDANGIRCYGMESFEDFRNYIKGE